MSNIWKGLTYSYNRNIGWQDRTIRTIFGLLSLAGAIYFYPDNFALSAALGGLFLAQVITVFSSRCMICYFLGQCTITNKERKSLSAKGVLYEE
ncbi:MAG: YgaP-like transmembrane domain [Bacteroidota bacterium]